MPIELTEEGSSLVPSCRMKRGGILAFGTLLVVAIIGYFWPFYSQPVAAPACAQPPVVAPQPGLFASTSEFLTNKYRDHSVELLSGAVQIPTESYDDLLMDPKKDPRFKTFGELHAYFKKHFPRASEIVETVNSYGLLYTISGTDADLKPVILMAHQDVVPVNPSSVDQWVHPPYSGYYDGEFVWGRGSLDTKNSLVGILEATESLLVQGWKPTRTILISFGFDEEVSGYRGAKPLAKEIEARYGPDSIHFIVDEGTGLKYVSGALFALPTVAEKGYVDIKLAVETPGGHSSMPPDHTGIGFAAEVVTELENVYPFAPSLPAEHPLVKEISCYAAHAPDVDPATRRKWTAAATNAKKRQALAEEFNQDRWQRGSIVTTQAIDVISGGVKVNALPEVVELTTNYRINMDSSVTALLDRYINIAGSVAKRYGLGLLYGNESMIAPAAMGTLRVEIDRPLEPVSSSPTNGPIWDLLGGLTRHIYEEVLGEGPLFFSPSLIPGNTDTKHYLGLTRNVYRYTPAIQGLGNAHTVNEHVSVDGHIAVVMWYYELLQVL